MRMKKVTAINVLRVINHATVGPFFNLVPAIFFLAIGKKDLANKHLDKVEQETKEVAKLFERVK